MRDKKLNQDYYYKPETISNVTNFRNYENYEGEMKTKVELIHDNIQSALKAGDKGYIDGYVRAADDRSYAVVIVGEKIDLVPLFILKVIQSKTEFLEMPEKNDILKKCKHEYESDGGQCLNCGKTVIESMEEDDKI